MDDLDARISRGEARLDAWDKARGHNQQWFEKVAATEFHKFNMFLITHCLLGRLFGNFLVGLEAFGIDAKEGALCGFASARPSEYSALTAKWKARICARLQEKNEL